MRDVVIIGGGLSGLAAADEFEQRGVDYTLIEVKNRLGGSINSVPVGGFIFDSGPMWHEITDDAWFNSYLERLGLDDALIRQDGRVSFRQGTGVLVDALAQHITGLRMMRMAVSTLGRMDAQRFSICLENGIMLDARAIVVAAPARHAERMFHTLIPEISFHLLDYRYDPITRVSLGYINPGHQLELEPPPDYPIVTIDYTSHAERCPQPNSQIIQAALRLDDPGTMADPVGELAALMGWPHNPTADHIATWTESDPIMWKDPAHIENQALIQQRLPDGIALIGSDYVQTARPPRLDERLYQGVLAAEMLVDRLK